MEAEIDNNELENSQTFLNPPDVLGGVERF